MLTICDTRDGQTFTGEGCRPIGFGQMLCMSDNHESNEGCRDSWRNCHRSRQSMGGCECQRPGLLVMLHWTCSSNCLHAASLVYSPVLCHPGMKAIEQDATVHHPMPSHANHIMQTVNHDNYISTCQRLTAMHYWHGQLGCGGLIEWTPLSDHDARNVGRFSGNRTQKDCQEHCKTLRWRSWFGDSQPSWWRWKFHDCNNTINWCIS